MRVTIRLLMVCLLLSTPLLAGSQTVLHLSVGDPERRDREADVVLDGITDTRTGDVLTPDELARRLLGVRLLLVGESHTSMDFHRVQLRVIRALHEAGRNVRVGLEMYPAEDQASLDRWVRGLLTETGFLELSRWYDRWGYHWDYYREIFDFARVNGIGLHGLNVDRDVISSVGRKGLDGLDEEERAQLPERIDTASDEHLTLFKSFFEEGEIHGAMSDEQWTRMLEAQCAWDAVMGHNALSVLERHGSGDGSILVVLVGSGHLAYDLGIQRQIAGQVGGKLATLIPVPVRDEDDDPVPTVRASFADFLWGLPRQGPPIYPSLGFSTRKMDDEQRLKVIWVEEKTPAGAAGVQMGDVLLTVDGVDIPDKETLNRHMSGKRWGDTATVTVRRGEGTERMLLQLRRWPPEPED